MSEPQVTRIGWEAPVELVLACTPPAIKRSITLRRLNRRHFLRETATVTQRGERFYGLIRWSEGPDTLTPLDVWPTETRP